MIKACVIGWPISHSRSPLIHGYWLKQHGIDGSYTRQPLEPEKLADFLRDLRSNGFAGCNCTIPHKEEVFKLVPAADDYTRRVGAINTVYFRDGTLAGTNTDGEGFIANLASKVDVEQLRNERVIILGAGGAALAIAGALQDRQIGNIAIANRTPERVAAVQAKIGGRIETLQWENAGESLSECRLLINTTSLGMQGQPPLQLQLDRLQPEAVVTDIVYTPLKTPLLIDAERRGNRVVGGLGMLLHQAVRGFSLWFGVRPKVTDELYDIVARDVDPDYTR